MSDDIKKKMLDIDKEREYDKNRKKDPEIMKKRYGDQTAYKRYYEKSRGMCSLKSIRPRECTSKI